MTQTKHSWKERGYKLVELSPDKVEPNTYNPNRMSAAVFAKEVKSIETNGFIDPIKVREMDGRLVIVDGEHRWRAAKELGIKTIPVINLGNISDAQAMKLTVIANELRGAPEPVLLAELLRELATMEPIDTIVAELPFSQSEIDTLLQVNETFDWGAYAAADGGQGTAKAPTEPTAGDLGQERKFQLGTLKGNIAAKLAAALVEEFNTSAVAVGSKAPELVLRNWLERLRASPPTAKEPTS